MTVLVRSKLMIFFVLVAGCVKSCVIGFQNIFFVGGAQQLTLKLFRLNLTLC